MGFLGSFARAATPAVTGLIQGQMAGKDRQRQQQMEALQAMLLQERLNEIPLARQERAEDRTRQSMLDAEQAGDRASDRKRQSRLDKQPGPESLVEGTGPEGKGFYAIPRGGNARYTGVAPIPDHPQGGGSGAWQVVDDFSGQYGPPGQKVRVNKLTGEVVPIAAQGRAPVSSGVTTAQRAALAENNALIADIDRTIDALRANPDATGLLKGVVGAIPGGQYALAGGDRGGDIARQGIGLLRSKVLHDFIGGAQTRVELTNLKDALPERGFDTQTNISRLQALKERAQRANTAIAGGGTPAQGGGDANGLNAWAGGDPEKLQFLREIQGAP